MRATIHVLRTNWWYLTVAMVVLAVMAAGVHTMTIAAPALAEQERLAEDADAAAERAIVPNPAATEGLPVPALLGGIVLAFAVGLSGGQLQRRRRAAQRTAVAKERPAPEPTPSLPVRPAPPPPEPVVQDPKPVALVAPAPPAAPPPPAPVRSGGPRILRFRAAPAPPPPEPVVEEPAATATHHEVIEEAAAEAAPREEPVAHEVIEEPAAAELVEEPVAHEVIEEPAAAELVEDPVTHEIVEEPVAAELVEDPVTHEIVEEPVAAELVEEPVAHEIVEEPVAPEVVEEPVAHEIVEAPVAPEVVAPPRVARAPRAAPTGPLGGAPELPRRDARPPRREVPPTPLSDGPEALRAGAPEPEPVVPARRFARAQPWPEDAETLWTCEIAWKAGYLKSAFRAMAGAPGGGRRKSIGESPSLRWTLMTDPEPPTPEMIATVKVLVSALVAAGWERAGVGTSWYAQRFVWRGDGEPRPVAIPDAVEPAEPPSR